MRWDLFCRVIDNHGDLGVCWRLACDLASRGEAVRLWIDDASALAWMAPAGQTGVQVIDWRAPARTPGEVVIELFGCDPPESFVAAMAAAGTPPLWINLEYLSAESWVERSHRLPSPQGAGAAGGLLKWFFFPGFTAATGGLLREPGVLATRQGFDRQPWLAARGWAPQAGERLVSLFCYPDAPTDALSAALADAPTLLLLCGGARAPTSASLALRCAALPWLSQPDYDRLLWSCDLNFVRGEDSLVRALWAGTPFVWQLYPQHDGVHATKLAAFARVFGSARVHGLDVLWRRWNGLEPGPLLLPDATSWRAASESFRSALLGQDDLVTRLLGFARDRLHSPANALRC